MTGTYTSQIEYITQAMLFRCAREDQDRLTMLVEKFVERDMSPLDGFMEATVHKSLSGDGVFVFTQWQSQHHHASMLKQPGVQESFHALEPLTRSVETSLFEKVSTFQGVPFHRPIERLANQETPSGLI